MTQGLSKRIVSPDYGSESQRGITYEYQDLLLSNFLEALPLASAIPKRVLIQFGQKWHGVHLGATNIPDEEDDPRIDLEENLYVSSAHH